MKVLVFVYFDTSIKLLYVLTEFLTIGLEFDIE